MRAYVNPWWSVSISVVDDDADREFYVQAATSVQAIIAALGAVTLEERQLIHYIHVGRPVDQPRDDMGAFGWHDLQKPTGK